MEMDSEPPQADVSMRKPCVRFQCHCSQDQQCRGPQLTRLAPLDQNHSPIIIATASRQYRDSPSILPLLSRFPERFPLHLAPFLPIAGDSHNRVLFDVEEIRGIHWRCWSQTSLRNEVNPMFARAGEFLIAACSIGYNHASRALSGETLLVNHAGDSKAG